MSQILPSHLPDLPPVPAGFDRWIYRGINYRRDDAYMWTSYDETMDPGWDPPCFMNSVGHAHTHYIEAVINHGTCCSCTECRALPRSHRLFRDRANH